MRQQENGKESLVEPSPAIRPAADPPLWQVVAGFAAIYVIWGSTYFGIRVAIETLPPFFMAGTRFLVAGALLYAWTRWRGMPPPTRGELGAATVAGLLLMLGGNGGVVWAETRVPSGVVALMIAGTPLFMVTLDWLRPGGKRPPWAVFPGIVIGIAGTWVLVDPLRTSGEGVDRLGALAVLGAELCWASGSLWSRSGRLPRTPQVATALQMLTGGLGLLAASLLAGEGRALPALAPSARSLVAWSYLVVFGSLVAFSAYVWLLRVSTPARVATYAYVNPLVALALGTLFAHEPLGPRVLAGAGVLLASVALITTARSRAG